MDEETGWKAKLLSSDIWVPVLFLVIVFAAAAIIGYPYQSSPVINNDSQNR
jgi:hypothetical protein